MRVLTALALLTAVVLAPSPGSADEATIILKPGPGADVVEQNCSGCHSLDYVRMNAPFLTSDGWKAEITKMRTAFGAPVDDEDAARILAYLSSNYGAAQ